MHVTRVIVMLCRSSWRRRSSWTTACCWASTGQNRRVARGVSVRSVTPHAGRGACSGPGNRAVRHSKVTCVLFLVYCAFSCLFAVTDPNLYFIGIIDTLTFYGAKKRAAHTAKELKHGVRQVMAIAHNPDRRACRKMPRSPQ